MITPSGNYYVADGPLSHSDVAILRTRHWTALICGPYRLWWQGGGFMLYGPDGITRVPYEGPQTLAVLNAAWQKRAGGNPA
jgi:hypothetical protein